MLLNQTWYLFLNSFIRIHNVSRVLTLITYCRNYFHSTIKYDRSVLHFEQASVKKFEWTNDKNEVQSLHCMVYSISSEICQKHDFHILEANNSRKILDILFWKWVSIFQKYAWDKPGLNTTLDSLMKCLHISWHAPMLRPLKENKTSKPMCCLWITNALGLI